MPFSCESQVIPNPKFHSSNLRHILTMPADIALHNTPAGVADEGDDFIALVGNGYFGFEYAEGFRL